MNKLVAILIAVIIILLGVVTFLLIPQKEEEEPTVIVPKHVLTSATESEFTAELSKHSVTIDTIETQTEAFYALSTTNAISEQIVFDNATFQVKFQYLESAVEHLEIFVYFDETIQRYYYFSPGVAPHDEHFAGYIDYDSNNFHIGHIN